MVAPPKKDKMGREITAGKKQQILPKYSKVGRTAKKNVEKAKIMQLRRKHKTFLLMSLV